MAQIDMKATTREEQRRGQLNEMRLQGIVPGIVYGHGKKPTMIKVVERDFRRLMHAAASENVIIKLEIEGMQDKKEATKTVILKEVQREPLAGSLMHIDFQEISLTEKIRIKVPVVTLGEAIGVTQQGGVLEMVLRDLEVECLPTEIPDGIEVDITSLAIGKALYVKDIPVSGNIKIITAPELTAIACSAPAAEIEAPKAEEAGAAEPEVITAKKTEEGAEAAGEGEKKGEKKAEKKEEGAPKSDKAEKKPEKQDKK